LLRLENIFKFGVTGYKQWLRIPYGLYTHRLAGSLKIDKMRIFLIMIFNLLQIGLFAQNDSLTSKTDKYILNQGEIITIKQIISKKDSSVDFRSKKIGFVGGIGGEILMNKYDFFNKYLHSKAGDTKGFQCLLIKLTSSEIKESGGFEFLIMYPPKIFTTKTRKKLIKELKTAS
jgi:hypothetical protein